MSQNSQENTCVRASFLWTCRPLAYKCIKKTLAEVFSCEFCDIFKNTFLTEHLWVTASVLTAEQLNSVKWEYIAHWTSDKKVNEYRASAKNSLQSQMINLSCYNSLFFSCKYQFSGQQIMCKFFRYLQTNSYTCEWFIAFSRFFCTILELPKCSDFQENSFWSNIWQKDPLKLRQFS